jgi:oxygen-dependent protoporphyrinogen oxidase
MGERRVDCVVVGAGITGLAAAHRLHELSREQGLRVGLCLLEERGRLGGNIRTERVDGVLMEGGPDQFVHHKPGGLALCRRLGLDGEVIEIDARQTATHVVRRGRPVRLPVGFSLMGPSQLMSLAGSPFVSWRGLVRAACEPWIPPRPPSVEDESLSSFFTRRFGRELHDRVFEPIMGGIFTADTDRLSLEMTAPQLLRLEREHGSIVKALHRRASAKTSARPEAAPRGGCVSLRGGLGRLIDRLAERIPDDCARTGVRVESVRPDEGQGRWRVSTGDGELVADAVILACPGFVSARLLSWSPGLNEELTRLEYASCATVNLVYPETALSRPLDNFGFFVGRTEGQPILACSHVSVKYPERVPRGRVLLRAFLGGARNPGVVDLADEGLVRLAHRSVAGLLKIEGSPLFTRAHRFPSSMPQYAVGYRRHRDAIVERSRRHPGLFPCGGVLGTIGLPDCIESGESAACEALAYLQAKQPRQSVAAS